MHSFFMSAHGWAICQSSWGCGLPVDPFIWCESPHHRCTAAADVISLLCKRRAFKKCWLGSSPTIIQSYESGYGWVAWIKTNIDVRQMTFLFNVQPWNESTQTSLKWWSEVGCKNGGITLSLLRPLPPPPPSLPDGSGVIDPGCHLSTSCRHAEALIAISLTDDDGISYLLCCQSLRRENIMNANKTFNGR